MCCSPWRLGANKLFLRERNEKEERKRERQTEREKKE